MDVKPDIQNPFPGEVHPSPTGGVLLTALDDVINWARSNSLWPLVFGTSCCAIEMMSTASAKYDWSRFGFEVARATPRQADVIIIAGTIVNKIAPVLKRLYDQMADPKYVIAMGACATSGGPFFYNTYSVVKGADHDHQQNLPISYLVIVLIDWRCGFIFLVAGRVYCGGANCGLCRWDCCTDHFFDFSYATIRKGNAKAVAEKNHCVSIGCSIRLWADLPADLEI